MFCMVGRRLLAGGRFSAQLLPRERLHVLLFQDRKCIASIDATVLSSRVQRRRGVSGSVERQLSASSELKARGGGNLRRRERKVWLPPH